MPVLFANPRRQVFKGQMFIFLILLQCGGLVCDLFFLLDEKYSFSNRYTTFNLTKLIPPPPKKKGPYSDYFVYFSAPLPPQRDPRTSLSFSRSEGQSISEELAIMGKFSVLCCKMVKGRQLTNLFLHTCADKASNPLLVWFYI